ncbi:hypothetical protein QZH41_013593 [Actinostola sp. cb2023]|nr:hypothetical protein QZH41_013593 [Actinostola sp. cb2023]
MAKLKFKVVRQVEVNKELFRYCLAFTITQKLAPLWNKTGEYFVQGRDFLECASKLNAVSIDVNITDRLCIGLKAFNIKLQLSRPDHFCSSSNILQSFLTQKSFIVNRDSIQDDLCYVLPSLKKGRVVGICHEIPSDSPFPCYEDLRRHWKLMYGYRLPPNESTFYNVRFFHFSNSKIFTNYSIIHSVRGTVQDQTSTSDQYADEVCRGNTSSKNLQQSGIIPRLWNGSLQGTPNKKQNITVESNAVQVKKPRLKPRIQEDIDVRQLALDNQLKKVNTITLMDWLRKHNVPVKQKDKKMELIEKVMGIVTSNVHES